MCAAELESEAHGETAATEPTRRMPRLRQAVSAQYAVLYSLLDRAEAPRGREGVMDQQTGQYRMYTCRDCGAKFSAVYSAKARGASVPSLCPECREARTRDSNRRCKARKARKKSQEAAREAMLARLAARDAAYAAHPHGAVTVSVRADGRRVITRGIVCGTGAGGGSKLVEPVPSTGYLHPAPTKAAGKDGAGKRDGDEL